MNGNGRRQTLGGLSPNQLNSRVSLGPSRVAKDGKAGKSGRPSFAWGPAAPSGPRNGNSRLTTVPRRSSAYNGKSSSVKSDPRPVSDKGYQQNCARTIINYLTTHNYDHNLGTKVRLFNDAVIRCSSSGDVEFSSFVFHAKSAYVRLTEVRGG
jgi:kinetochore protein NDC80